MTGKLPSHPQDDTTTPPAGGERPHHVDSVLESMGKAITDAVRESAGEVDDKTKAARHKAQQDTPPHDDNRTGTIER